VGFRVERERESVCVCVCVRERESLLGTKLHEREREFIRNLQIRESRASPEGTDSAECRVLDFGCMFRV
jgi:hypothetical protein